MAELECEQRESDTSGCALARCISSLRRNRAIAKIQNTFSQVVGVCGGERRPPLLWAHKAKTAAVPTVLAGLAQRAENRCLEWVAANFDGSNGKVFSFSGHTIFVTIVQPCHCSCRWHGKEGALLQ